MPPKEPQSPSLEALRKLIEQADTERVVKKDFEALAKQIIEIVKADKSKSDQTRSQLTSQVASMLSSLQSQVGTELQGLKTSLSALLDEQASQMRFEHEAFLAEAQSVLDNVKDGEDADESVIVEKVLALLPPKEELKEETPEELVSKLSSLEGDERLDISAIKGLDKELGSIKKELRGRVGGVVTGHVTLKEIIITAAETPDDSTVIYTFVTKPQMVNVNGAFYAEGHGWAWTNSKVVLDNPVGTGGHIFGLK